jgi:hypothetical protein
LPTNSRRLAVLLLVLLAGAPGLSAQQPARTDPVPTTSGGIVTGIVTTQDGTIPLGGVLVSLSSGRTTEVRTVWSEPDGRFRFEGLPAGEYHVSTTLEGFDVMSAAAKVEWNRTTELPIDLKLAVSQTIEVVGGEGNGIVPQTGTLTAGDAVDSREIEQLAPSGGFQAALRLLVSVIEVPGGVAIKGGRPSQAAVQLGPGTFVDPATGLSQVKLPDDAIDKVTVLPNPYAVEYGRFSSGLVLIQTRRASDRWRTRVNNLDPSFRTERGNPFKPVAIAGFGPRMEVGGPLVPDRLYLQQSVQYRYRASEVASRPPDELKTSHAFSTFTRVDANVSSRHSLIVAAGFFPSVSKYATLGTFTPPEASADIDNRVDTASVTERSLWSSSVFTETTAEMNRYRTDVEPQRPVPMALLPETTLGAFYNRQRRTTSTYQLIETVSGTAQGFGGLHLFKAGVDVLHSRFDGTSTSRTVDIRRSDGSLARRLQFGRRSPLSIRSTDLAVFAQDRVQPTSRWYVEFGGRLDRDGVIDRLNFTPRTGTAVLLNASGSAVLRGGVGFFFERTPSAAGVFEAFEAPIDTRFAADGVTPLGAPVEFRHVAAPELRTSRSLTWDAAYDHRFTPRWALHLGVIDRRGSHELQVERLITGPTTGQHRLSSDGRSAYREAEIGVHYTAGTALDVNASYVRSFARADLNAFTSFFDSVMWPVVGRNQYAPARADAPNRVFVRARAMPAPSWLLVGILDWRTGLPYSVVDEALEFVGSRNSRRFPRYARLEVGVDHRVKLLQFRPWIGVRVENALNAWLPTDVQHNIGSPAFGTFYNSEFRQLRIQVRFER